MRIEITEDDREWEKREWRPEIKGWSRDIVPFYAALARALPRPFTFVELGVYHGRSLLFLNERLAEIGGSFDGCKLVGVDPCRWDEGDWPALTKHLAATERLELIHIMRHESVPVSLLFESVDAVFIDGDHSEVGVLADIDAWTAKVKPGGILAGHDFAGWEPGVERAVRRRFTDAELNHYDSTWWVYR